MRLHSPFIHSDLNYVHNFLPCYNVRQILDASPHSFSLFWENKFCFGSSVNVLPTLAPVLHLLLIVLCPKMTAFWVAWVSKYVGFSFWPFALRSWQKWFSTTSWLRTAGLIVVPGNRFSFVFTNDIMPRIIACRSNQSLDDTNSSLLEMQALHSEKYDKTPRNFSRRGSFTV